jgi:hypothetical protein
VETRGNGQAEGGGRADYGGKADGLRRKADGGVSELRMCSYLAGLHSWTTEEFVRLKRVVGVRFSEVALLCGCCVLGGEGARGTFDRSMVLMWD